jgi:Flp pilus assembly pilin Flp
MKPGTQSRRLRERGATLVEFAFVAVLLVMVIFAVIEIERMVLVYTTISQATDAGVRYAIVHGSKRTATGVDGPSGPGTNPTEVVNVIKYYAGMGLLDVSKLDISVTYPSSSNDPGQVVKVSVGYPYDPLTVYFPLSVNLASQTQGVITF